jgi:hypothetical protein
MSGKVFFITFFLVINSAEMLSLGKLSDGNVNRLFKIYELLLKKTKSKEKYTIDHYKHLTNITSSVYLPKIDRILSGSYRGLIILAFLN